jgi:histone deacetylase 1/2
MQIRAQLMKLKKLDQPASVYFSKIQTLSDILTSIGLPLRQEEFITYVLGGLGEEYDALVEVVSGRTTPIPTRDLYSQLLNTEQRIETRKAELGEFHSANASFKPSTSKPGYRPDANRKPPVYLNNYPGNERGGGSGNNQERNGGNNYDRGGERFDQAGRGRGNGGNRHVCQLCGKVGHLASQCFKRFKREFLGIGNDGRYTDKQVAAATSGHSPSYPVDTSWYADTGATDHLTSQLDKLTTREDYRDRDQVRAANGSGMQIRHIGQSLLPTSNSNSLKLNDVLHVPSVTRNLLSVHRLTKDNNVFFLKFTLGIFLLRIVERGTFFLEVCYLVMAPEKNWWRVVDVEQ